MYTQMIKNSTEEQSNDDSLNINTIDLDHIIDKLLGKLNPKGFVLNENQISGLCAKAKKIIIQQPMLLQLEPPINVCGDIHGQYHDLLKIFKLIGSPQYENYLFLGDYIDRGKMGLQCICLLLIYKIKHPNNFFLLRGNHQCSSVNKIYGFYDECKQRMSIKVWNIFCNLFNYLPVGAVIGNRIFCTHGGLSPNLANLSDLNLYNRPLEIPKLGPLCDLLWADPMQGLGWLNNIQRGVSYSFGVDVLQKFLKKYDFDLLCRSHQVVQNGYEFFGNKMMVTIFSATNYCGLFENRGGVLVIDHDMKCQIKVIEPQILKHSIQNHQKKKKRITPSPFARDIMNELLHLKNKPQTQSPTKLHQDKTF